MACPFDYEYTVYCPDCSSIVRTETVKDNHGTCPNEDCGIDLSQLLEDGEARIITLPVKTQLLNYLGHKDFKTIIRVFSGMKGGRLTGELHDRIFKKLHFSLYLGIDAADMTNDKSTSVLPAILFITNLPVTLQHRYPILASIFVGKSIKKPHCSVMLHGMQQEIRDMGRNPLTWYDDRGVEHVSRVFLTVVQSDAPQNKDLQNQVAATGEFPCNWCFYCGEQINDKDHPHVFCKSNKKRRTKAKKGSLGIR
jgi:hypothetical protein